MTPITTVKPEIYLFQLISLMNLALKGITYQVNTVENLNFPNLKKKKQNNYLLYGLLTSNLNSKQNDKVIQFNPRNIVKWHINKGWPLNRGLQ